MSDLIAAPKSEDFGIIETKAHEINAMFQPMLESMVELEKEYNTLIEKEVTDEVCKAAKELAKKYKEVRIETSKKHRAMKDFYLKGGRFVDSWKHAHIQAAGDKEDSLKYLADYFVNKERERIEALNEERMNLAAQYEDATEIPRNLGEMPDKMWKNFLAGLKKTYEDDLAERKRIEEEEALAQLKRREEEEKLRKENEKLKAEAKERELKEAADRAEIDRLEKDRLERERVIAEMKKMKEDQEHDRKRIEEEKKQAELSKGDEEKITELVSELEVIAFKYSFKSTSNQNMFIKAQDMLQNIVQFIEDNT